MAETEDIITSLGFFLAGMEDGVYRFRVECEYWSEGDGAEMSNGKPEAGTEIFQEATIILIFMFMLIKVPEYRYSLIDKIGESLCKSMCPQYFQSDKYDYIPIILYISIFSGHTKINTKYLYMYNSYRPYWKKDRYKEDISIIPKTYFS